MTSDDARELFSDALEGELEASVRADFDAALAADAELSAEYEAFAQALELTRNDPVAEIPAPNLLPEVQRRLRVRSRGRFYADRFAQRAGTGGIHPVLLVVAMALLLGLAWAGLEALSQ